MNAAKPSMSVEEYLQTSFDDGDREFVEGEILERNVGEQAHSNLISVLLWMLMSLPNHLGFRVRTDVRVQITPDRFRVPDLAVWTHGNLGPRIASTLPFLVIEVVSPEDRPVRVQAKVSEYLKAGIEHVWVLDPIERSALAHSQADPAGQEATTLTTQNPAMEFSLAAIFEEFDRRS